MLVPQVEGHQAPDAEIVFCEYQLILTIPLIDEFRFPSLGGAVCDFIEDNLVFGPGDLLGLPAVLAPEKKAFIWRMYEIYPEGHELEGRRRFERVALSLPKGCAKTELAAWIAAVELHPNGPVRFKEWDAEGKPVGQPVMDPYIPMFAYTEAQTELLAYGALKAILEESPVSGDYDIGLQRITRYSGEGKAEALASSPNAADGARTTFAHFDETHRFTLPSHKELHIVNLGNISKRIYADGWSLETTTAPEPGARSVAEETHQHAEAVRDGKLKSRNFFFYHRQASEDADLTTEEGAMAALVEAYGPAAEWANLQAKINLWSDPQYPDEDWARYFLNLMVKSAAKAFDPIEWAAVANVGHQIPDGALVTLGFDGAMNRDSTALVATDGKGFQQVLGLWEQPYGPVGDGWQVPASEVDDAVTAAFQRYQVWRLYADPYWWEGWLNTWAGRYGERRVVEWRTNRPIIMSAAIRAYQTAISTKALTHDGNESMARHVANAYRHELKQRDVDTGVPYFYIKKERPDSPNKIDCAMAGILSWDAYLDAVAAGMTGDWTFGAV